MHRRQPHPRRFNPRRSNPVDTFPDPRARREIFGELAALGPFFAADVHGTDDVPSGSWRPVRELVEDPRVLDERISRVRTALARKGSPETVDARVAASVAQLGLVARLIAPVIAMAALELGHGRVDDWWWQDVLGGPFPLSIALGEYRQAPALRGVIESLTELTASQYGVSSRTVWGNIASATNGAAQMITRSRPDVGQRAREAADVILADPCVEGGRLRSGPTFRRTSCCLIYRLDAAASPLCGDCVLQR